MEERLTRHVDTKFSELKRDVDTQFDELKRGIGALLVAALEAILAHRGVQIVEQDADRAQAVLGELTAGVSMWTFVGKMFLPFWLRIVPLQ